MACIKCGKELYHKEENNVVEASNMGIEITNYFYDRLPKHVTLCRACSEEIIINAMSGNFGALLKLPSLLKGIKTS